MAIYYNGTNIPSNASIYYNGSPVAVVCAHNGSNHQVVWPENQVVTFDSAKSGTSCHSYTDGIWYPSFSNFKLTETMSGTGLASGGYRDLVTFYKNGLYLGVNWADNDWPQNNDKHFCWGLNVQPYSVFKDITMVSNISCIHVEGCAWTSCTDADGYDEVLDTRHVNYTWTGSCIQNVPTNTSCATPAGYPYCGGYIWTPSFMQGLAIKAPYCDGDLPMHRCAEDCHGCINCTTVCVCWGLAWTSPTGQRKYCWLWCNRGGDTNWGITRQITLS